MCCTKSKTKELPFKLCFVTLSGIEAAGELPGGGAEEEGESLGLHTQPAAATDRLPQPREQFSTGWGINLILALISK